MFIDNIKYTLTTFVVALFSFTFIASCGSADSAEESEANSFPVGQTEEFQFLAQTNTYEECTDHFELCSIAFVVNGQNMLDSVVRMGEGFLRSYSSGISTSRLTQSQAKRSQAKRLWNEMMQLEPDVRHVRLNERWNELLQQGMEPILAPLSVNAIYQNKKNALVAEFTALMKSSARLHEEKRANFTIVLLNTLVVNLEEQIEQISNRPDLAVTWEAVVRAYDLRR